MVGSLKDLPKSDDLNNSKQKVNDTLGNPVEIGVAVWWRCGHGKAVFHVDNYKNTSLQCDSAVRGYCAHLSL